MTKRIVLAVLAVFIAWSVLDFVIHGIILRSTYEATAELWRPMDEMKMGLMHGIMMVSAIAFTLIYALLVEAKSVASGLLYGSLYGIGVGIGMGYGTYCVMPLPHVLALAWFLGTVFELAVGGLLLGLILRAPALAPEPSERSGDGPG